MKINKELAAIKEELALIRVYIYIFIFGETGAIYGMTQTKNPIYQKALLYIMGICILGFLFSMYMHSRGVKKMRDI
ncbi:MAG: hypothetical protein V3R82_01030 [Candidatus Hydrothermarchaeales archaeon]